MPNATDTIDRNAREDREVAPRIQRVAETNALITMARLDLTASERRLMEFIIGNGGAYAGNQWVVSNTLKISRRTLSWAQRRLAQKGLLDLKYTGRLTRYTIRLEGVQMALKSASSKGCATHCASIYYEMSQTINLKREDISAEAGGCIPPPIPQDKVQRVATPPGGASGSAQPGAHPEFMRGHPPRRGWRDNPNLTTGQRMVHLWQDLTGRLATPQDKGLLKAIARETQEPEALLAWAVRHWNLVGDGVLDWADTYPAGPSLGWLRKNVGKYQRAFYMEPGDLDFLASDRAREARQEWRKGHRESGWRGDESWRDGPHAKDISRLRQQGKMKEARALIEASNEAWRTGPHAGEIEVLLARGRDEEGKALMRESNRSYYPSADKMEWLAAGDKVRESWRIGPLAGDIGRLLCGGKRKEAEAMMIKDFEQWKGGPRADRIKSLLLRGRTDEAEGLIKQANMEAAEAAAPVPADDDSGSRGSR